MKKEATWTFLVHADAKTGKSRLMETLPAPRLIIDTEGRGRFLRSAKVWWDPRSQEPPVAGDWETCIAPAPDFASIEAAYRWLRSGNHPFVSTAIDSLMEAQKRAKDVIVPGVAALRTQDWGELFRRLERVVRDFRDLRDVPETGVRVVAFVTGTRETDSGRKEPLLEGGIRDQLAYYIDTVGYLYKTAREDGSLVRGLLVDQQPGFVAGDGTGYIVDKHGPVVWEPNLAALFDLMKEEST